MDPNVAVDLRRVKIAPSGVGVLLAVRAVDHGGVVLPYPALVHCSGHIKLHIHQRVRPGGLFLLRHLVWEFGSGGVLLRTVRKAAHFVKFHFLYKPTQFFKLCLGLAGEAYHKGGTQCQTGNTPAHVGNQLPQGVIIAIAVHGAQHIAVAVLQGNINIGTNFVLIGDYIDQFIGDPIRIAIVQPDPADPVDLYQPTQQLCQAILAVQILAIQSGILGN